MSPAHRSNRVYCCNNNIAIINAGVDHAVATHPHKIGGGFVADKLFVQVNTPFHIIICCGAKPCCVGGGYILLFKLLAAPVAGGEKFFLLP